MSPFESESQIRQRILEARKALSNDQVDQLSNSIVSRFLSLSETRKLCEMRLRVGLYSALPSEVNLDFLFKQLQKKTSWQLFFPKVMDRVGKKMGFIEVPKGAPPEQAWETGPYGVREPRGVHSDAISPADLDLIFVPGVVFGVSGERIGMGAGYYDRYLSQLGETLRVALAFDFQVQESLFQKPTDQPVHWVFTEARDLRVQFVNDWMNKRVVK